MLRLQLGIINRFASTEDYQLRWPVGPDAEGMFAARFKMPSEAFIEMGDDISDEEYNALFLDWFGTQL